MHATRLEAAAERDVVSVLSDAFSRYPVMEYVLGSRGTGGGRLEMLIGLFVFRRIRMGGPMFGVADDEGRLAGAAVMTLPGEPDPAADVLERRDRVFESLGLDCRQRHDTYATATRPLLITEPHHHLNMIGVRHDAHGRGFARPLLEAAIELAEKDPNSAGLTLTTELPRNVSLYEHFGFVVTGRAPVAGAFETWGMFRRSR